MYIERQKINDLFEMINGSVEYVLIKNISSELPNKLIDGKDIDILVNETSRDVFEKIMVSNGYQKKVHPLGVKNGWSFLYGLPEYQFWKCESKEYDLFVDVSFMLCCKSLQPKMWIPFDKCIQERIWKNRRWDNINKWWRMDEETTYIYLISRCVFDKAEFKASYIKEIEALRDIVDMDVVKELLNCIYFRFTDELMRLLDEKRFCEIRSEYIKYSDY